MYDSLLRIKQFREQNTASAVTREQRRMEEKAKAAQQAREQTKRFNVFRAEEEIRLFEQIKGKTVNLREIDQMKMKVAGLRDEESQLEKTALEAEQALEQAKFDLRQARDKHGFALREQEKFEQFIALQRQAEERRQQRKEEMELEEITEVIYRPGRGAPDA